METIVKQEERKKQLIAQGALHRAEIMMAKDTVRTGLRPQALARGAAEQLAMSVYSASLDVECTHCHEAGNWASAAKPAHAMVEKMLPIFDEIPKHFDQSRMPRTQCYMCHQGQRVPSRKP